VVVVMQPGASAEDVGNVVARVEAAGGEAFVSSGVTRTIIGLVGDIESFAGLNLRAMPGVADVMRVSAPYKLVSRTNHPQMSTVLVGGVPIGPDTFTLIAGPCAVETPQQTLEAAEMAKAAGATLLRGGAYKPRTSPYAFQGLGEAGLKILADVREATGLPVVTEVVDPHDVDLVSSYADMLQVGTRNMANFGLLQAVGQSGKPVMLKRGMQATIEEWLMAAEYIAQRGNLDIVLCERGIRTFERATRNTLDVSAVPVAHGLSHLPVIVDPSHSGGRRDLVVPLSRAAIAVGADGIIVDVHPHPDQALCDGPQALVDDDLRALAAAVRQLPPMLGRRTGYLPPHQRPEDASRLLDVAVVDVQVGDRAQVPPVEQAEQHALLAAGGHDVGRRVGLDHHDVGLHGDGVDAPGAASASRSASRLARRWSSASRSTWWSSACSPAAARIPTWRIPPPSRLRHTRAAATRSAVVASSDPIGAPSPLDRQTDTVSNSRPYAGSSTPLATWRVPQAGAVEVQGQARVVGDRPQPLQLGQRLHGAATEVVGVLDGDRDRRHQVRAGVRAHQRGDRVDVDQPAVRGVGAGGDAGERSTGAELGPHHVRVGVAQQLLPGLHQQPQPELVGHRAARREDRGLLPEQLGDALLERGDGRVLPVDVVADRCRGHRVAHRGGRAGDGVAAEVDRHGTNLRAGPDADCRVSRRS
jgi:3-deoxy-7-phosphoheptulonate synthase